jgi:addiction module HigA family antidote
MATERMKRACFNQTEACPTAVIVGKLMMAKKLAPMHPGEVLREEFLAPLEMSPGALAKACGVPRTRIERIASEATGITADTALRLSKAFGTTAEFWLNLQSAFDIRTAKNQISDELAQIKPVIETAG